MLLYQGSSEQFITDAMHGALVPQMRMRYFEVFHTTPNENEVISWENSLRRLADVFTDIHLEDHGILLEYQMPMSSRRLDCLISGKDADNRDNAVIIELKQWSSCQPSEADNEVMTWVGGAERDVLHPSVQVGQYAMYLDDVNTAFYEDNPVRLSACAFLHNYQLAPNDPLLADKFQEILKECPVFTKEDTADFEQYLSKRLNQGGGVPIADRIAKSPVRTNKKLMEHVVNVIKGKPEYILLDEQKIVYDKILAIVKRAFREKKRQCVIIQGGPGTGKSVIALNLMADLLNKGVDTHYATGSQAFTETLRTVIGKHSTAQFKYFNSYMGAECGSVPVIICDEAHRIRETSNNRFTRINQRSDKSQIDEILWAGKICVFFIDDKQAVRPNEIGSTEYIRAHAARYHFDIWEQWLEAQFRCLGSESFLNWVDSTLQIRPTNNILWDAHKEEFDFQVVDTPVKIEQMLQDKLALGFTARMVAGFCWPWSTKLGADGELVKDVQLEDYKRPWNAPPQLKNLPHNIPKSSLWAYDEHGFGQVGCIYTAQGFEFDYVGVIFGKDLVYDMHNHQWQGHPEASEDYMVKRSRDRFLELVKNTYRVLLSRGMKGCYVYFEDEDTRNFVMSRMEWQ